MAAHIQYFYRSAGYEPNLIMDHYTPTSLSDMISIGMGFAFVPSLTWPGIANEYVKLVKIADVDFHRYVILSWPYSHYISNAARQFRTFLMDYFAGLALNSPTF